MSNSHSDPHLELLTSTLTCWRERLPQGGTIDEFARGEIAARWRAGHTDGKQPTDREAWANREYTRLYLLSMELANYHLLRIAEPPQIGVPVRFRPVAPWYQRKETTTP